MNIHNHIIGSLSNDDGDAKDDAWSKMNLYFTCEFRDCLDLFSTPMALKTCSTCNDNVKFQMEIRKISRRRSRSPRPRRTWSFHVVVLQRTAKKCTKSYNARAQPLFCSLYLLFGGVLVAVVVMVCLSPVIRPIIQQHNFNCQRPL